MVFKNKLFFSSKKSDTSSPDGSNNSPRSIGSNSPIRSDKKKPKSTTTTSKNDSPSTPTTSGAFPCRQTQVKDGVKKKESVVVKGKETASQAQTQVKPGFSGSGSGFKSKKAAAVAASAAATDGKEMASSVSPILASSLGLNRIKTRSGPLPQESFYSFRGDKPSGALGSSNLSRPGGGGGDGGSSSNSNSGSGRKKESRMVGFQDGSGLGFGDNGNNWDTISTGSGQSREVSPGLQARTWLQNGESSSGAGMQVICFINISFSYLFNIWLHTAMPNLVSEVRKRFDSLGKLF